MSINKVLSFLKRQGVITLSNNNKLDTDLATSYLSILFESDRYSDQHVSNKDYFAQSVKTALLFFDCHGSAHKIYTSLCYFFDEILNKEAYYEFAEKLVHKMSTTKHLSKYVNIANFKNNCMADFDPTTVEFKKTEGMILKDEQTFLPALKRDFHYKRIVLCYDQLPGLFIFDTSATFLDLDNDIYVYFFDVNNEAYQFDDEGIQINKRRKTITVSLPMRSNVIIANSPIIRRTVQKLDDKTAELQKKALEKKKSQEIISNDIKKTVETDIVSQQTKEIEKQEDINETSIVEKEKEIIVKPLTAKEIRSNPELLNQEKIGLKNKIVSNFTSRFFFYPAISAGRYKLNNKHLKALDITYGFCMKGFNLKTFELLDDGVKILGKIADGTIVYEVTQDCHVVVFAGKDPQTR